MKKLIFTVFALIALANVSFAKKVDETNTQELKVEVIETPCTDDWSADMNLYQTWGYSYEEALDFADEAWDICMEETYG